MKTTSERELSTTANSPSIEISPPQRPTLPDAARRVPLFLGDVTIMVDSDNSARFPGWYDDPSDSAMERFWDGRQWTESVRDAATAQAANAEVLVDLTSVQATVGTLPAKDKPATTARPTDAAPLKDAFAKDVPAADAVRKAPPVAEAPTVVETPVVETPAVATPPASSPKTTIPDTAIPDTATPVTATPETVTPETATPAASKPAAETATPTEPSMGLFAQPRSSDNTSAPQTTSPSEPDAENRPSLFDKRAEAAQKSEALPLRSASRESASARVPQPAPAAKPAVTSMADIIRTTTVAAAQSEAGTASSKAAKATPASAKAEQASKPASTPTAVPKANPRPKADIPKPRPVETPKVKPIEPAVATPTSSTSTTDNPSQKRWGVLALLAGACLAAGGFLFGYLAGGSGDTAAPSVTTDAPTTTIAQTEPTEPAVDQGSLDALAAAEARVEELESASAASNDQVASLEGDVAELTEARDNESAHNELLQSWFTADVLARSQGSWDAEVARGCGLADEPTLDNLNYGRRLEVVGTPADLLAAVLDCRG